MDKEKIAHDLTMLLLKAEIDNNVLPASSWQDDEEHLVKSYLSHYDEFLELLQQ